MVRIGLQQSEAAEIRLLIAISPVEASRAEYLVFRATNHLRSHRDPA